MKFSVRITSTICALLLIITLAGCGGGGEGTISPNETVNGEPQTEATQASTTTSNSYSITDDNYGLQNATFLSASNSNGLFVIRAAIANSLTDPNFRTIFRINILQPAGISAGNSYSLGGANSPAEIIFFNGRTSTLLNTTSGSITFTSFGLNSGNVVSGSFTAIVEDQIFDQPRPIYTIKGNFNFVLNTSGLIVPLPTPVPSEALGYYDAKCGYCHSLGSYDPTSAGGAPDLSMKGGEVPGHFTGYEPGHVVVNLSTDEIFDLKILMNAK